MSELRLVTIFSFPNHGWTIELENWTGGLGHGPCGLHKGLKAQGVAFCGAMVCFNNESRVDSSQHNILAACIE